MRRISEITYAFFMTYIGNRELMDRELVAFFASRTAPPEAFRLARRWAYEIARTDRVVISGFHSPIEREVLDVLLSHSCSVIVALGRSLYRRIPTHLCAAYEENRLLMLSFRDVPRASRSNSQIRNWAITDFASEVVFAPFASDSPLASLYDTLRLSSVPIVLMKSAE